MNGLFETTGTYIIPRSSLSARTTITVDTAGQLKEKEKHFSSKPYNFKRDKKVLAATVVDETLTKALTKNTRTENDTFVTTNILKHRLESTAVNDTRKIIDYQLSVPKLTQDGTA